MKRYLLFMGYEYSYHGGWNDFIGDYNTLEEAKLYALNNKTDWFQIVDITTNTIVLKGD